MTERFLPHALLVLAQAALLLLLPPLVLGVIAKVKARFAGRVGPPLLQVYFDLARLWRKDAVYSRTSTWVFLAGPVAGVAVPLVAGLMLPMLSERAPLSFDGDLVVFCYLFGLSRFLTVLSALDTGSSFEGMGAAREASFAALAEPALFFGLAALVRHGGGLGLAPLLAEAGRSWAGAGGPYALVLAAWAIVFLVENCRIPFDDPNTHLELTMIHEVMVLDHSGPALALVTYGASLKLFVVGALVVKLCLGATGRWWLDGAAFLGSMGLLALATGVVESTMVRLRMRAVPQLLVAAALSATFAFLMLLLQPTLR